MTVGVSTGQGKESATTTTAARASLSGRGHQSTVVSRGNSAEMTYRSVVVAEELVLRVGTATRGKALGLL